MLDPLISVIVPVFNGERFIAEAIASIADQSYAPLEILVIDDASTDGSAVLAMRLAEEHSALRLLRQRRRSGPAAARNKGLAAARGDLITFLDVDDVMTPGRLHFQAGFLAAHPEVELVVGTAKTEVFAGIEKPALLDWAREDRPSFCQMSMMARRVAFERVGWFDESFRVSSDTEWMYRAEAVGVRTGLVDRHLLIRRVHGGNLIYQTDEIRHAMRRALLKTARSRVQNKREAS